MLARSSALVTLTALSHLPFDYTHKYGEECREKRSRARRRTKITRKKKRKERSPSSTQKKKKKKHVKGERMVTRTLSHTHA